MHRASIFAFGVFSYVLFNASFLYFAAYLVGFVGPDPANAPGFATAMAINVGLVMLFGVTHSGMARDGFKRWLTRFLPKAAERSVYVFQSSVFLTIAVWGWQSMPGTLWHVEGAGAIAIYGVFGLGLGILFLATFLIDHFELFGLRQIWANARGQDIPAPTFKAPLLYKIVRHPMQLGVILALFATPHMSVDHLVMSIAMSAYVLVGLYFEERALKREFGQTYLDYMAQVPMLIPTGRVYRASAVAEPA